MKNALILFLIILASAARTMADSGQYGQYGQYGGGAQSGSIIIDKRVSSGTATKGGLTTYVDNYSSSDPRFSPGTQVYFEIKVKNTSSVTMTNVQLQDTLPAYVDAVEGPGGYDPNTRTISWVYPELKSGEEKIEKVVAKVYDQGALPTDKGLFCLVNSTSVRSGGSSASDTAQFCVEKQVALTKGGVPLKTPQAGAEYGLILSALSFVTLSTGIYLKKKTS